MSRTSLSRGTASTPAATAALLLATAATLGAQAPIDSARTLPSLQWMLSAGLDGSHLDWPNIPFAAAGAVWRDPDTGLGARLELTYRSSSAVTGRFVVGPAVGPTYHRFEERRETSLLGALQYELFRQSPVRPFVFAGGGVTHLRKQFTSPGMSPSEECAPIDDGHTTCTVGSWHLATQAGVGLAVPLGPVELVPELRLMHTDVGRPQRAGVMSIGIRF